MKIIVPPIKSQGIKTKLIPWILDVLLKSNIADDANWIEPFFGTGVVGFNSPMTGKFIVGDTNPHIINFYKAIQQGIVTKDNMRTYLERESELLSTSDENGYVYYRQVRNRFNSDGDPFDFIFLSRSAFNGMMRFNKNGHYNTPFCKKPKRFSKSYITKICNQVENVNRVIHEKNWTFMNSDFKDVITLAGKNDIIYCDPPYYGRYVDYYNDWTEENEMQLFELLTNTKANFILSTWHHNEFRENEILKKYWSRFNILTSEHFYHFGGHIENRHSMTEALVFNFDLNDENIMGKRT